MSFCPICGARNNEDASFCAQCGTPIQGGFAPGNATSASQNANPYQVGANTQTAGYDISGEAPEVPNPFRAFVICMKKYVDAKGRAGRAEYFGFGFTVGLIGAVCGGILGGVVAAMGNDVETERLALGVLRLILSFAFLVPGWCLAIRRLHDLGASGWISLINLIPLVNFLFGLVLCFTPGQAFPNKYGLPPQRRR